MKILFMASTEGFCSYYRMLYPFRSIERKGLAEVKYIVYGDREEMQEAINWADVIHFQAVYPSKAMDSVLDALDTGEFDKVIGLDMDDNLFKTDPMNPAYEAYGTEEITVSKDGKEFDLWVDGQNIDIEENKKKQDCLSTLINRVDFITCTNEHLRDELKNHNKNAFVIPNYIDQDFMTDNNKKDEDKIIIGYQGGNSHFVDFTRTVPVLERIKKEYGDKIGFRIFGPRFDKVYSRIEAKLIPWVKPRLFFDRFSAKRYDIGLIPLEDTEFNRCKSNIKWLEHSYYGIPSVVENVTPYKEHITHETDALLFSNDRQLYKNLKRLIDDESLRREIAGNARECVIEKFDIDLHIEKRVELYSNLLEFKKLYNKK